MMRERKTETRQGWQTRKGKGKKKRHGNKKRRRPREKKEKNILGEENVRIAPETRLYLNDKEVLSYLDWYFWGALSWRFKVTKRLRKGHHLKNMVSNQSREENITRTNLGVRFGDFLRVLRMRED